MKLRITNWAVVGFAWLGWGLAKVDGIFLADLEGFAMTNWGNIGVCLMTNDKWQITNDEWGEVE